MPMDVTQNSTHVVLFFWHTFFVFGVHFLKYQESYTLLVLQIEKLSFSTCNALLTFWVFYAYLRYSKVDSCRFIILKEKFNQILGFCIVHLFTFGGYTQVPGMLCISHVTLTQDFSQILHFSVTQNPMCVVLFFYA